MIVLALRDRLNHFHRHPLSSLAHFPETETLNVTVVVDSVVSSFVSHHLSTCVVSYIVRTYSIGQALIYEHSRKRLAKPCTLTETVFPFPIFNLVTT